MVLFGYAVLTMSVILFLTAFTGKIRQFQVLYTQECKIFFALCSVEDYTFQGKSHMHRLCSSSSSGSCNVFTFMSNLIGKEAMQGKEDKASYLNGASVNENCTAKLAVGSERRTTYFKANRT